MLVRAEFVGGAATHWIKARTSCGDNRRACDCMPVADFGIIRLWDDPGVISLACRECRLLLWAHLGVIDSDLVTGERDAKTGGLGTGTATP